MPMRVSTRTRYGARAALEIARSWGNKHVKRREIAERQQISDSYLENILIALKAHGLVKTVRGANGGFSLTRAPDRVSLFELFQALEGELTPVECTADSDACDRSADCVMRQVYQRLENAQKQVLTGISLQDLVDQARTEPDFCI
ncbi:MAG: Rrf2 family transcriptional regulator [Chitinivibrionales bacterium]|nr:Rrf2 family transcriptional regulator [Chitinivibrionales bacterium]